MSLCFKIEFVAMVATLSADAARAATTRQAQPAQPAEAEDSYSLPGRGDFDDASSSPLVHGRDAPTLLASQSSTTFYDTTPLGALSFNTTPSVYKTTPRGRVVTETTPWGGAVCDTRP
jgi:hypothetical protein